MRVPAQQAEAAVANYAVANLAVVARRHGVLHKRAALVGDSLIVIQTLRGHFQLRT